MGTSLLWLLLPHILMDLDPHTLGSAGSLLSFVLLSPYICTSIKLDTSSLWSFLFYCYSSCVSWSLPGHVGLAPLGNALACSVVLLDPHTMCIRYSVSVICILPFCCSVLYATPLTCLSVLGEGSLLRGSPWGFVNFFLPVKSILFFHTGFEGLRTQDVVHYTDCKSHWGNVCDFGL